MLNRYCAHASYILSIPQDAAAIERLNETGELKNLVKEFKVRENFFLYNTICLGYIMNSSRTKGMHHCTYIFKCALLSLHRDRIINGSSSYLYSPSSLQLLR
jgi:hypothetical protein